MLGAHGAAAGLAGAAAQAAQGDRGVPQGVRAKGTAREHFLWGMEQLDAQLDLLRDHGCLGTYVWKGKAERRRGGAFRTSHALHL